MVTYSVLTSLGDAVRRQIVHRLSGMPLSVNEIVAGFDISRPAISRHLRVLRESGVVSETRSGRERIYRLERSALEEAAAWLLDVAADRPARSEGVAGVSPGAAKRAARPGAPDAPVAVADWRQW